MLSCMCLVFMLIVCKCFRAVRACLILAILHGIEFTLLILQNVLELPSVRYKYELQASGGS